MGFFESIWNEIKDPFTGSGSGTDVDNYTVDDAQVRRMGLTYKGRDEDGNRVWEDAQGHRYNAVQLQKHDDGAGDDNTSPEPLAYDFMSNQKAYYNPPNPVTDTGYVTGNGAAFPNAGTQKQAIIDKAMERIKRDLGDVIKQAMADGKAVRINIENKRDPGDKAAPFYYQEQTPGNGGGLLIVNVDTNISNDGQITTGYPYHSTSTASAYGTGDIAGPEPGSSIGTGGSGTGGTGSGGSGGGTGGTGTGGSGGSSGGGSSDEDEDGDHTSHDCPCDCDEKESGGSGKNETTDTRNDPTRVTYTKHVTQKPKNEVTESAMLVRQSPAVRGKRNNSPADKEDRLVDEYTKQKEDELRKQAPKDAGVIIRYRFWDNSRTTPDGERIPTIRERRIKSARPGTDNWIFTVDVEGLTNHTGFVPSGSMVGKWSVENPIAIYPLSPSLLKRFPTHVQQTIVRPVNLFHFPPPPKIEVPHKPQLSIPKPVPPPPVICLACYYYLSQAHFMRDMIAVVNWLKDNPDYYLELIVDGIGRTGDSWSTVVGKVTLWERVRDFFIQFYQNINKYSTGSNLGNRLKLTPGTPDGVSIKVQPILIK